MKKFILTAGLLLLCSRAFADCVDLAIPSTDYARYSMRQHIAVRLLCDAGNCSMPVTLDRNNFCATGLTIGNTITPAEMEREFLEWRTESLASASTPQDYAAALIELERSEIKTNRIGQIDAFIDAQIDPIQNLTQAKAAMKVIFKKLARYLIAKEVVEGQR